MSVPLISVAGMRILHTSDWHIGRSLHGADRLADQERVLGALVGIIVEHRVDVVLVAGDIYDRAIPQAAATAVLDRVLTALRRTGAQLVIIPGNHDSAVRLGYAAGLLATTGVHLLTSVAGSDVPVVLDDTAGPVAIYGIPYLDPALDRRALGAPHARSHADILAAAMDRIRVDLAAREATRSVVLAHAFVSGGQGSPSERDISVGGVDLVPASVFAGTTYVALGHLHRAQRIGPGVEYSGSPLAYSFTEATHRKSVTLVDLGPTGLVSTTRIALTELRALVTLTGTMAELLVAPEHDAYTEHYVSAVLTDATRPVEPMRRLQQRFPCCVHLEWVPPQADSTDTRTYGQRLAGRDDLEISLDFVQHVRGTPAHAAEVDLLTAAIRAGRTGELTG